MILTNAFSDVKAQSLPMQDESEIVSAFQYKMGLNLVQIPMLWGYEYTDERLSTSQRIGGPSAS